MKDVVQKPIQSLHSFGRHFCGGSIAALLPFFCYILVFAEPQDTNRQLVEEKKLDILFNKIMLTMPEEAKVQVDSAATADKARHTADRPLPQIQKQHLQESSSVKNRLDNLPEHLKFEVEQTISDMQKRQDARKTHFRESRKPHH